MQINQIGLAIVKQFEDCVLAPYRDSAPPLGHWTIGYGHLIGVPDTCDLDQTINILRSKKLIAANATSITQQQADQLLLDDLAEAEIQVQQMVKTAVLTSNQFSALVSLVFNIGGAQIASSTLIRFVNSLRFADAQEEFHKWVFANHQKEEGLVRRRAVEAWLFLTPDFKIL